MLYANDIYKAGQLNPSIKIDSYVCFIVSINPTQTDIVLFRLLLSKHHAVS